MGAGVLVGRGAGVAVAEEVAVAVGRFGVGVALGRGVAVDHKPRATCAICHGQNAIGGVKDLRHMSPATHAAFLPIVLEGQRAANGMASGPVTRQESTAPTRTAGTRSMRAWCLRIVMMLNASPSAVLKSWRRAGLIGAFAAPGTYTYTVTQDNMDNGSVTNAVKATNPDFPDDPDNPPPGDDVTVPAAGMTVEKTADKSVFTKVGEEIEYSIVVTNTGNVTLSNVRVADELPGVEWTTTDTIGTLAPNKVRYLYGYPSAIAALSRDGIKVTEPCEPPVAIICDTHILRHAPSSMIGAGLGDLLSKSTSSTDWLMGHVVLGEYFCEQPVEVVGDARFRFVDGAQIDVAPLLHQPPGDRFGSVLVARLVFAREAWLALRLAGRNAGEQPGLSLGHHRGRREPGGPALGALCQCSHLAWR